MTEYPFGKGKLTVPGSRNGKRKFLEDYEVEKLIQYIPENDSELRVLRIVKFNLNAGLRIGDVFTLRKSDIIVQELSPSEKNFRLQKTTSKTIQTLILN
jgi:integrase